MRACRHCHTPVKDRAELSATGLCPQCGELILWDNVRQLIAHTGPRFDYWRERCLAAFSSPRLERPPERS